MSGYNPINLGFTLDGEISRGELVELNGDMQVTQAGEDSTAVVGVALTDGTQAEGLVTVEVGGSVEVAAVGTITAGDLVAASTNGAVKTIGAGTFDQVVGRALRDAADNKVEILLK